MPDQTLGEQLAELLIKMSETLDAIKQGQDAQTDSVRAGIVELKDAVNTQMSKGFKIRF